MIHLYLIDYYHQASSGLTTYVNLLGTYLTKTEGLKLHYIWAKSNRFREFSKETDDKGTEHYHLPGILLWAMILLTLMFVSQTTCQRNIRAGECCLSFQLDQPLPNRSVAKGEDSLYHGAHQTLYALAR